MVETRRNRRYLGIAGGTSQAWGAGSSSDLPSRLYTKRSPCSLRDTQCGETRTVRSALSPSAPRSNNHMVQHADLQPVVGVVGSALRVPEHVRRIQPGGIAAHGAVVAAHGTPVTPVDRSAQRLPGPSGLGSRWLRSQPRRTGRAGGRRLDAMTRFATTSRRSSSAPPRLARRRRGRKSIHLQRPHRRSSPRPGHRPKLGR
jgi:hypothetical protein